MTRLERLMQRASEFDFLPGCRLRTCSAEDFVVMKAFANRDRDWVDVESVLIRQGKRLKWKQILNELRPLSELKESPDIVTRLEQVRREVEGMK